LIFAIQQQDIEGIQLLLENRAIDLSMRSKTKDSPLEWAIDSGNDEILMLIINKCPERQYKTINPRTNKTPLMLAKKCDYTFAIAQISGAIRSSNTSTTALACKHGITHKPVITPDAAPNHPNIEIDPIGPICTIQ
jgi:hypothetical protein